MSGIRRLSPSLVKTFVLGKSVLRELSSRFISKYTYIHSYLETRTTLIYKRLIVNIDFFERILNRARLRNDCYVNVKDV